MTGNFGDRILNSIASMAALWRYERKIIAPRKSRLERRITAGFRFVMMTMPVAVILLWAGV